MVATRVLTAADIVAMGAAGERLELVDGVVWEKQPMGRWHGAAQFRISLPLGNYVIERDLGMIYPSDTQYIISRNPDRIHIPDVSFVRKDRHPPMGARDEIFSIAPDIAIEVLSWDDSRVEAVEKVARYHEAGVPLVWLVDLRRREVEVHALGQPPRVLGDGDVLDGGTVLPDFRLPVADIFR